MRVLHLDTGKEMRGGQRQALRLIEGLAAEGVESTFLSRLPDTAPINLLRVARMARRHDLVHAHDSRSHTMAALAGGAPLIVSRRVAFEPREAGPRPARPNWKYSRPAHHIAVSEFVKASLTRRGVPSGKITVVYDGVPLLDPSAGSLCLAPATADPRKGAALAREAARLAGVELRFSENLERDLPSAGILVYISHSEGLGSAALLALAAGVPVIASKVGGLPEIVRHRENGLLVENEPAAIAEAIRELSRDPGMARQLGAAGRQMVAGRFTIGHMVRRTMEVYFRVLSCS